MSKTFFTSDTHFGHEKIIGYCGRPFQNVEDMNVQMVSNWNKTVAPEDTVYHLGDFSFRQSEEEMDQLLNSLNGEKHLIKGNHDLDKTLRLGWHSISSYEQIKISDRKFVLFHYPIEEWEGKKYGSIHLHGHIHSRKFAASALNRFDVGVDNPLWNFSPVPSEKIIAAVDFVSDVMTYTPYPGSSILTLEMIYNYGADKHEA